MTPKKVVLITGSTSGIGLEIAKNFLKKGFVVCINYSSDVTKAEAAVSELSSSCVQLFQADVSDECEVKRMFEEIRSSFGRLDVLINNAGTSINEPIDNVNLQNFKRVLDVNLIGKVLCTKYAIPLLKESSHPCIINIASRLGIKPCLGASAYCASEAAIINFTQASVLELSPYNIRVNSVSPGLTLTPLTKAKWSETEMEIVRKKVPLERLANPSDIATVVCFLASSEADYINGENINVSGGILLT